MHMYTHLGAVPRLAKRSRERRDGYLARTGPAARAILHRMNRLPRAQRIAALNQTLNSFQPGLAARVQRVANHLQRSGMTAPAALERAIALSLADASIEKLQDIGRKYRSGSVLPVGGMGLGALGADDAGEVFGKMMQGIACSGQLKESTTDVVGRNEGADAANATSIGFEVVRGMALCPVPPVQEPPSLPPAETTEESSSLVPVLIGVGALAAVGGVVYFATRK